MKRYAYAVAILVAIGGCSSKNTEADDSAANSVANWTAPVAPPEPPAHRYDFKEGLTYGYIADVSEEQKKAGQAAGEVLTFTYHGNEGGIYRLRRVDPKGVEMARYECTKPCVAIKAYVGSDLTRIAYTPDSVIGSAYQDALNGLLEPVREPVKPPASAWAGEYNGTFEGDASGSVTIKDRGDQLAVSIGVGAERCVGEIAFTAPRPAGIHLEKRFPRDDSGNQCIITLARKGRSLGVNEEGCSYYHGAECSFNGAATK